MKSTQAAECEWDLGDGEEASKVLFRGIIPLYRRRPGVDVFGDADTIIRRAAF